MRWRSAAVVAVTAILLVAGTAEAEYESDWESLRTHDIPEWFRDAKFGVWTVWGPHSVPAYQTEWYGHHMYRKGSDVYKYHVENYGNPSEFGYKDFIPMWKASKFDPDSWAELYEKSGARYAGLMAIYHDTPRYEKGDGKNNIGYWGDPEDYVSWDLYVPDAGIYYVKVVYPCAEGAGGSRFAVQVGERSLELTSQETGAWNQFEPFEAGTLKLDEGGRVSLKVRPVSPSEWKAIGLQTVTLVPKE